MNTTFPHKHSAKNLNFINAPDRHRLLSSGVGAGKTLILIYVALREAIQRPGSTGWIAMKTYKNLRDVIYPKIWGVLRNIKFEDGTNWRGWEFRKGDNEITFENGSKWCIRNLADEGQLQGPDLDYIVIDELIRNLESDSVSEEIYEQLTARIRGSETSCIVSSTNPGAKSSWVYDRWIAKPRPGYMVTFLHTMDNKDLPKSYLADLGNQPEVWKQRFLSGEWGVLQGAAFRLEHGVHIRDDPPTGVPRYYLSFDWGYTDPFWCVLFQVTDGHVHIMREYHATQRFNEQHLPFVRDLIQGFEISGFTADSADNSLIVGAKQIRWWSYHLGLPYYKAIKNRWERHMRVLQLMEDRRSGRPALTIDSSCKGTIDSITSLVWDEGKNDIAPGDDHGYDSVGYGVMGTHSGKAPNIFSTEKTLD